MSAVSSLCLEIYRIVRGPLLSAWKNFVGLRIAQSNSSVILLYHRSEPLEARWTSFLLSPNKTGFQLQPHVEQQVHIIHALISHVAAFPYPLHPSALSWGGALSLVVRRSLVWVAFRCFLAGALGRGEKCIETHKSHAGLHRTPLGEYDWVNGVLSIGFPDHWLLCAPAAPDWLISDTDRTRRVRPWTPRMA